MTPELVLLRLAPRPAAESPECPSGSFCKLAYSAKQLRGQNQYDAECPSLVAILLVSHLERHEQTVVIMTRLGGELDGVFLAHPGL